MFDSHLNESKANLPCFSFHSSFLWGKGVYKWMLIISIFLWNVLDRHGCFYLFIYFGKFDIQVTHFYFGMFTLWLSAELREALSPVCQNQAGKLSQHRWRCIHHLGVCRWYAVRETTQAHTLVCECLLRVPTLQSNTCFRDKIYFCDAGIPPKSSRVSWLCIMDLYTFICTWCNH